MLGKELKRVRVDIMNKTLKDISGKCGFTSMYLSDIENGKRIPKNGCTLKKLSKGYDVHFDMIIAWLVADIKLEAK